MSLVEEYIKQLDEIHKQVYEIAKEHLGSSFDIEKSIGFLEFKRSHEKVDSLPRNKN